MIVFCASQARPSQEQNFEEISQLYGRRKGGFIRSRRVVHVVLRALIPGFPVGPGRQSLRNCQRGCAGFLSVQPPTARRLLSVQIPLGMPATSSGQSPVRNSICLSGRATSSIISSTLVLLPKRRKLLAPIQPSGRQIPNNSLAMFINAAVANAAVRFSTRNSSSTPLPLSQQRATFSKTDQCAQMLWSNCAAVRW